MKHASFLNLGDISRDYYMYFPLLINLFNYLNRVSDVKPFFYLPEKNYLIGGQGEAESFHLLVYYTSAHRP